MIYEIVWSPLAKKTYFQILEYLAENWTGLEVVSFIRRTEDVIELIRKNPRLYPVVKKRSTHRCILVKQVILFYRLKPDKIELLIFWDTRQDPKKLSKMLDT